MIGGQHHRIGNIKPVDTRQKRTQGKIQMRHLIAHLRSLIAIAMTNIVCRTQRHGKHIGSPALAELVAFQKISRQIERDLVK